MRVKGAVFDALGFMAGVCRFFLWKPYSLNPGTGRTPNTN